MCCVANALRMQERSANRCGPATGEHIGAAVAQRYRHGRTRRTAQVCAPVTSCRTMRCLTYLRNRSGRAPILNINPVPREYHTVLCERCQRELPRPERRRLERFRPVVLSEEKVAALETRYRSLLSTVDSVDARDAKSSQLSRFGLGEEGQPLFSPSHQ